MAADGDKRAYRRKAERLIADLRKRGVGSSTVAPPLFRLLWAFGLRLPPPLFMGFLPLALLMGTFFSVAWGVGMGLLLWLAWRLSGGLAVGLPAAAGLLIMISLAVGLLFGLIMAVSYRWQAARLRLPPWKSYAEDPEAIRLWLLEERYRNSENRRMHSRHAPLLCVCRQCGTRYALGVNSMVATFGGMLQHLQERGNPRVAGAVPEGVPDLIGLEEPGESWPDQRAVPPPLNDAATPSLLEVLAARDRNESRRWKCQKCDAVNPYPWGTGGPESVPAKPPAPAAVPVPPRPMPVWFNTFTCRAFAGVSVLSLLRDPATEQRFYATVYKDDHKLASFSSRDAGRSWEPLDFACEEVVSITPGGRLFFQSSSKAYATVDRDRHIEEAGQGLGGAIIASMSQDCAARLFVRVWNHICVSEDDGTTFRPLLSGVKGSFIGGHGKIAADVHRPDRLYSVGHMNDPGNPFVLLIDTQRGTSKSVYVLAAAAEESSSICVDPQVPGQVYATAGRWIYGSGDFGESWQRLASFAKDPKLWGITLGESGMPIITLTGDSTMYAVNPELRAGVAIGKVDDDIRFQCLLAVPPGQLWVATSKGLFTNT